jgi:hypothetical protein
LTFEDDTPVWEPLPEDEPEDEDDIDLRGEMDADYGYDPDADFSEPQEEADVDPSSSPWGDVPDVTGFGDRPDLIVIEAQRNGQQVFAVALPQSDLRPVVHQGLRGSRQAESVVRFFEERQRRLWQVGRMIIERQRDYFASPDAQQAYLRLKPLTQDEAAEALGIHKGSMAKLVSRSMVQTPRFGVVPLEIFFAPAGGTLGVRTDVLAAHIQAYLKTEDPQRPYFAEQICTHLQSQGLLPQTRNKTERLQMERLLRRVMQDYNIASRAQRRRSKTS